MIPYQPIIQPLKTEYPYSVDLLRLDLLDAEISGNKWFKLKHNLEMAKAGGFETLVTFGGPFSNHIAATAAACQRSGFKCIGIIRGEEQENETLSEAKKKGMFLHFVSRELYSQKEEPSFIKFVEARFGNCYIIPEGGNNTAGVQGATEILTPEMNYDYIFCACGTGTTYAGLLLSKINPAILVGISVLKGENKLPTDVLNLLSSFPAPARSIAGNEVMEEKIILKDCIINSYAFKGYARPEVQLLAFKKEFEQAYGIPLDHIYTSKLMYAVFDLMKKEKLHEGAKLLLIHSGGLQGNTGFEQRFNIA